MSLRDRRSKPRSVPPGEGIALALRPRNDSFTIGGVLKLVNIPSKIDRLTGVQSLLCQVARQALHSKISSLVAYCEGVNAP